MLKSLCSLDVSGIHEVDEAVGSKMKGMCDHENDS